MGPAELLLMETGVGACQALPQERSHSLPTHSPHTCRRQLILSPWSTEKLLLTPEGRAEAHRSWPQHCLFAGQAQAGSACSCRPSDHFLTRLFYSLPFSYPSLSSEGRCCPSSNSEAHRCMWRPSCLSNKPRLSEGCANSSEGRHAGTRAPARELAGGRGAPWWRRCPSRFRCPLYNRGNEGTLQPVLRLKQNGVYKSPRAGYGTHRGQQVLSSNLLNNVICVH